MPLGQQPHVTTTFLVERAVTQELGQAASVTPTSLREAEVPTVAPGLPDLTPTPLSHVLSAPATRPPRLPGRPDTWPAPLQSLRPQPPALLPAPGLQPCLVLLWDLLSPQPYLPLELLATDTRLLLHRVLSPKRPRVP